MIRKRLARYAFCILVTIVTSCLAVTPQPINPLPAITQSASQPTPQPASNGQIWNLKNADIHAVIQTISVLTGKNFIIDPRVHGTITLISQNPMKPDELYQVFLSMLQTLQYVAIPSGNVIKIVPSMDANALSRQIATSGNPGEGDEIVVRVVPVNHVSATELVPVLRPLMSQSGSVTAYLPSNALILAGTAANIKRLVKVVHQMDVVNASQISVIHLHYANAKKVVSIIHTLQSGAASQGNNTNATLAADEEDNSILISANLANQLMMKNLIQKLDQPGAEGDDTKVVTLDYLSAKKLAPILLKVAQGMSASDAKSAGKTTTADSGSNSNISIEAEDATNAIIMHAPKAMLASLMHVVRRLDSKPREVLIEAIIVKVNENLLNKLGIQWGTSDGNPSADATTTGSGAQPSATIASSGSFAVKGNVIASRINVGLLPDGNLIALLHALNTNGSSDVLSTPSIVVLDNEKASIIDGQNVGVADTQYQGASSTTTGNPAQNIVTPFNKIKREDVALTLKVTPHVSPNHMIRMALLQEDDTIAPGATGSSVGSGNSNDNPTINTSKIKTAVLVKSGDILVLGGLIDNQQQKTVEKIPVLGNLPLIGHLFRYEKHQLEKTSLMVFIRPVIMSKKLAHKQTMNRYAYVRHQQIDLETEAVKKQAAMPILPLLKKNSGVILQGPMKTVQLPQPGVTQ